MSTRLLLGALACALSVSASACGGDDESAPGAGPVAKTRSKQVVVQAGNGAFSPEAVYESAAPGVVTIRSILGSGAFGGGGQGSGFVISSDGEIATNAHVVTDAEASGGGPIHEAKEVYIQFADRNEVRADIVGFDPFADVALLRVDPEGLDLRPLPLGSADAVDVGEPVAAIGSPFGEEQSLSTGVVSANDRSIESLTDFQIDGAIQTDASINPGNSGGPLLDAEGRVIGINQQINSTSGGNEGVGFAVPIDLVRRSLDELRDDGDAQYAYIGVTTQPLYPQLADRLGLDVGSGALVSDVVEGGPADRAGVRGSDEQLRFHGQEVDAGGDVIVAVNGEPIVTQEDLPRIISRLQPGDDISVAVIRDGERQTLDVTLDERPDTLG